jgi:hypothetical protein
MASGLKFTPKVSITFTPELLELINKHAIEHDLSFAGSVRSICLNHFQITAMEKSQ